MTRSQDKDTEIIKSDRNTPENQYRNQPALNFGAIPVKPGAGVANAFPIPPLVKFLAPIKVGKWVFDPKFKQRGYVPYLMGAAFALLLGVVGVVIYLTTFQTRPQAAAAQSGTKKLFTLTLETSAGSGEPGSQDGFGSDASFNSPTGVTADSQGNIYVCDTNNNAVRKINTTGFVSTLAGNASQPPGFADGKRGGALFNAPIGITLDSTSGLLFVVDSNNSLIRQIDPADGAVTTIAGNLSLQPDFQDGQATSASFSNPFGIASDSLKNLYITDSGNNLVRKINSSRYVSTFAGVRSDESRRFGAARVTTLNRPLAITIDAAGILYFVNQGSSQILKITTLNDVTAIAPFVNLTAGTTSSSSTTTAIAVDSSNNLWIALSPPPSGGSPSFRVVSIATQIIQNISLSSSTAPSFGYIAFKPDGALVSSSNNGNLVLSFSISVVFDNGTISRSSSTLTASSKIASSTSYARSTTSTSLSSASPFPSTTTTQSLPSVSQSPAEISTVSSESPSITNTFSASVSQSQSSTASSISVSATTTNHFSTSISLSQAVVSTVSAESSTITNNFSTSISQSQASTSASISESTTTSYQTSISFSKNQGLSTPDIAEPVYFYNVTTLAGSGSPAFADGLGLAASFNNPNGVTVDSNGLIYVADYLNHKIRKISSVGNVTTFAGSESSGNVDGLGLAASFNKPNGVALDSNGSIYVADTYNHKIRKISSLGNVTTLAGSGSPAFADGLGMAASFKYPYGVAVDSNGTIYLADYLNNKIRKISPAGNVTTLAGSGSAAFADGVGLSASFRNTEGVAVDSNGSIYVADFANDMIRKISSSGNVSTLAGSGLAGSADGLGLAASFRGPTAVTLDSYGSIYVTDYANHKIRKISSLGNVSTLAGSGSAAFADGVGLLASFQYPTGVAVDSNGTIYVADYWNHLVRKITLFT